MGYFYDLKSKYLDFSENNDLFSIGEFIEIKSFGIKCKVRKMKILDNEILIPEDFMMLYGNSRRKNDKKHLDMDYVYHDGIPYWELNHDLLETNVKSSIIVINKKPKVMDGYMLEPKHECIIDEYFNTSDKYDYILASGCSYVHVEIKDREILRCIYAVSESECNGSYRPRYNGGDYIDIIERNQNIIKGE